MTLRTLAHAFRIRPRRRRWNRLSVGAGDHALRLVRAQRLIDKSDGAGAMAILADLIAHDPDAFFDPAIAFDRRIFTEFAYDLIGLVHLREQRFQEATAAFLKAAECSQEGMAYRCKAAVAAGRAGPAPYDIA